MGVNCIAGPLAGPCNPTSTNAIKTGSKLRGFIISEKTGHAAPLMSPPWRVKLA
jgi:hypothetical protein